MVKILCVEDESDIREMLVEEIREAGFLVLEASNGRQGYEMILAEKPDIVLCDITMPEMDGRELFAELQMKHPELADMQFIFLTALSDKGQIVEGLRTGADGYLTKPIDFDVLMAKLSGCVMRQDTRRAASSHLFTFE
jgi:DNA-binding response OmpR family regulator